MRSFVRVLLWFSLVLSAVFLIRYLPLLESGQAVFAEDFHVYREAARHFDAPYRAAADAEYFKGETRQYHPYLNPPYFLFAAWPIRALDVETQLVLWYGAQILLWLFTLNVRPVRMLWPRWSIQPGYLTKSLILTLPFFLNTLLAGQIGLLLASLLLLGLALLKERPALAGALLALVSIKPQLLLPVAVFLLAARRWEAIAAAAATVIFLASASTAVWGADIWLDYARALELHAGMMRLPQIPEAFAVQLVSVYGGLKLLGVESGAALGAQAAAAVVALLALFAAARSQPRLPLVTGLALATVFLTSFYVLQYDAVVLVAVILILMDGGYRKTLPLAVRLAIILALSSGLVVPPLQAMQIPAGALTMLVLWWQCRRVITLRLKGEIL